MKACIVLHNKVVQARQSGHASDFLAEKAVGNGSFLDVEGREKDLKWRTNTTALKEGEEQSASRWFAHVEHVNNRVKDSVPHRKLKMRFD